jgi:DNA invertase Pin-like site-specific DNA recombinase/predicted metal-binding protein
MEKQLHKIKYFLYARKSSESEDRQVASIDSQIKELQRVAEREGLKIIEVLSESKSAKEPGRPIFNKMIERISNNEAQGIICWKLDRLARNPVDGGNVQWMLQREIIKHIQTYERGYYPTDNVLMMSVEFGVANQFILDLKQNTKRGLKNKAERGWYPGLAPFGYTHNPIKRKGEKEIIKDPERFDLVKRIFDLMLKGQKPPHILEIANNKWAVRMQNGKPMHKSMIYRIFTNPFYYGTFEYPKGSGNWYKGNHEPMITEEQYDRIQVLLGRKGKTRPKSHNFAFTGIIRCGECGSMITAEEKVKSQKNGNIHQYVYYHCTKRKHPNCSQRFIEQKELEKQILEILGRIEIPAEFHKWAIEQLKRESYEETKERNKILENQKLNYQKCLRRIDKLMEMRMNEEIDQQEFLEKKSELLKEKSQLQELLNDTNERVNGWVEKTENMFNFAEKAKARFETGTAEDKRQILSALGSNLLLKDRILSISIEKPLILIEQAASEVRNIHSRLEPVKTGKNRINFDELYLENPILLRR